MRLNHWFYGGVNTPDDLTEQELAQIDDDLSRRAGADMSRRAKLEGINRLAMDMIEPVQQPRPISVAAAGAMSANQLNAMQDRRQQGVQFQQAQKLREEQMAREQAMQQQEMAARGQYQQQQLGMQREGFKQRTDLETMRAENYEKRMAAAAEAKQQADAEKLRRGVPYRGAGGELGVQRWDDEIGDWVFDVKREAVQKQGGAAKEPRYNLYGAKDGNQYLLSDEEFRSAPPGSFRKVSGVKSPEEISNEAHYKAQDRAISDLKAVNAMLNSVQNSLSRANMKTVDQNEIAQIRSLGVRKQELLEERAKKEARLDALSRGAESAPASAVPVASLPGDITNPAPVGPQFPGYTPLAAPAQAVAPAPPAEQELDYDIATGIFKSRKI